MFHIVVSKTFHLSTSPLTMPKSKSIHSRPSGTIAQRMKNIKTATPTWFYNECLPVAERHAWAQDVDRGRHNNEVVEVLEWLVTMRFWGRYTDLPGRHAARIYTDAEAEDMSSDWDVGRSDSEQDEDETEEGSSSDGDSESHIGTSMGILKGVLNESPLTRGCVSFNEYDWCLVQDVCPITGEVNCDWSDLYKEKIKKALRAVEREHGDSGLRIARWAVRNRFVECISGLDIISYETRLTPRFIWKDKSAKWFTETTESFLDEDGEMIPTLS
ncbi:uncharacterized protein EV420DRAFT_1689092 [Desarmillaria tabescens]|uniref:Uncharacterized protein n=1 Tax=Armillaria tabescens TaxID=1929756 RepID=A0AA39N532_ARMTA|nr:uncharacterized protein EV420DRAFT_1689092 [Desarmillaria tabescens]KAK0457580.1 hypothetical protein EV420DRAFT_1689092 [Desarmillaria tabescens]